MGRINLTRHPDDVAATIVDRIQLRTYQDAVRIVSVAIAEDRRARMAPPAPEQRHCVAEHIDGYNCVECNRALPGRPAPAALCGGDVGGATCNRTPHTRGPHIYDGDGPASADAIGAAWEATHPLPAAAHEGAPCELLTFEQACEAPTGTVQHRWSDKDPWTGFDPDDARLWAPRSLARSQYRRRHLAPLRSRVAELADEEFRATFALTPAAAVTFAERAVGTLREYLRGVGMGRAADEVDRWLVPCDPTPGGAK